MSMRKRLLCLIVGKTTKKGEPYRHAYAVVSVPTKVREMKTRLAIRKRGTRRSKFRWTDLMGRTSAQRVRDRKTEEAAWSE